MLPVLVSIAHRIFLEKQLRKDKRKQKPKLKRLAKSTRRKRFSAVAHAIQTGSFALGVGGLHFGIDLKEFEYIGAGRLKMGGEGGSGSCISPM